MSYILKFASSPGRGRWEPAYFTELLAPSELKNKNFVSKGPPAGYGGVLVGVYRPPNPRRMLLPGSECPHQSPPSSTSRNRRSPVSPSKQPLRFLTPPNKVARELRGKTARSPLI